MPKESAAEPAEIYRRNAARCLRLSAEAMTVEARSYWISQAQFWHSFARYLEEDDCDLAADLPQSSAAIRHGAAKSATG